jgi:hypothetical protein
MLTMLEETNLNLPTNRQVFASTVCVCVGAVCETDLSVVSGSGVGRLVPTFVGVTALADGLLIDFREGSRVPSMRACRPVFRRSGSPRLATIESIVIRTEGLATNRNRLLSRRALAIIRSVVDKVRSDGGLANL